MGSVETLAHKGTGVVCQAVKKIVGECSGEPRAQPCILEVSDQGLRMVDRSKPEVCDLYNDISFYLTWFNAILDICKLDSEYFM